MKKILAIFVLLFSLSSIKAQDTIYVSRVLPDTLELLMETTTSLEYILDFSYYYDANGNAKMLNVKTARIDIDPKNILIKDDKVYYILPKKDKKDGK